MSRKTHSTRQKLVFRLPPAPPPRNPVAVAARQRLAGAHQISESGRRGRERSALVRMLRKEEES